MTLRVPGSTAISRSSFNRCTYRGDYCVAIARPVPSVLQMPDARIAFELICRIACLSDRIKRGDGSRENRVDQSDSVALGAESMRGKP